MAAKGVQAVSALLNGMALCIPLVGAGSPIGQALAKAMTDIGKHIPPGAASPQGEGEFTKMLAMRQAQMRSQQAAAASQQPGAPGGAAPAAPRPPMAA